MPVNISCKIVINLGGYEAIKSPYSSDRDMTILWMVHSVGK